MANLDAEKSAHLGARLPSVAASAENTGRRVSRECVYVQYVFVYYSPPSVSLEPMVAFLHTRTYVRTTRSVYL